MYLCGSVYTDEGVQLQSENHISGSADCIRVDSLSWIDHPLGEDYDFDDNDRRSSTLYSESVISEFLRCPCNPPQDQLPDFRGGAPTCAEEGQQCVCDGMVRFGAGHDVGGYGAGWSTWKEVVGAISCSTEIFGDPHRGTTKTCQCADGVGLIAEAAAQGRATTVCAAEGGPCKYEPAAANPVAPTFVKSQPLKSPSNMCC